MVRGLSLFGAAPRLQTDPHDGHELLGNRSALTTSQVPSEGQDDSGEAPADAGNGQQSSDSTSIRAGGRGWRCWRRLEGHQPSGSAVGSRSSWVKSCLLLVILIVCMTTQGYIFWQATLQTPSLVSSSPLLKMAWISSVEPSDPEGSQNYEETQRVLDEEYGARNKRFPYVGNPTYMTKMRPQSRGWYNSLAVFPGEGPEYLHGRQGLNDKELPIWRPKEMPPHIDSPGVNRAEELKRGGGFYLKLSDALPLDRLAPDARDPVCLNLQYDLQELSDAVDASIVITFYNEPMSTLLRTLHSVLNSTPPPLLREILLVDDGSNSTALIEGSELDEYLPSLAKVRLLRMRQRSGIVPSRTRGISEARAPVVVILDSHIEVNKGWLEPQLARVLEKPESFVFPQIPVIKSSTFEHSHKSGIGCFLTFDWTIQEKSSLVGHWGTTAPMASPMHAGGLLAFRKETFNRIGGYDLGFGFWGAENVELSFRIWLCGARLECAPCASVYHIYREGGFGYELPKGSVWGNRMRTAKLWLGDYFPLAAAYNPHHLSHPEARVSDLTEMRQLQERLQCKDIKWFLEHVDPKHEFRDLKNALAGMGDIRSRHKPSLCLDSMGETDLDKNIGIYPCHGQLGHQGFLLVRESKELRLMVTGSKSRSRLCLKPPGVLTRCADFNVKHHMHFNSEVGTIRWGGPDEYKDHCLGIREGAPGKFEATWTPCKADDKRQKWKWDQLDNERFLPLDERPSYRTYKELSSWRPRAAEYRSKKLPSYCLDTLAERVDGSTFSTFLCHGAFGTQAFSFIEDKKLLMAQVSGADETEFLCIGPPNRLYDCTKSKNASGTTVTAEGQIKWREGEPDFEMCLTIILPQRTVAFEKCRKDDEAQLWVKGTEHATFIQNGGARDPHKGTPGLRRPNRSKET